MKLIDDILEKQGAKYIKYKHLKGTNITQVSYKIGKEKKSLEIQGDNIQIKLYELKQKYAPDFQKHKEELDRLEKEVSEKFKPVYDKYQEEVRQVTLSDIESQVMKQI